MALDLLFPAGSRATSLISTPAGLAWLTAIFWLALASVMLLRALLHPEAFYLSTDDAMRLTQVRDLLAGQSWFDTSQHRMNTPFGVPMHWSRIADAGIAGLILLFGLLLEPQTAEAAAIRVWPLIPLFFVFLASARLGSRLAGRVGGLVALLLAINCSSVTGYFRPGSIDHHNLHMALTLWATVFLLDLERYRGAAIGAGLLSGLSLAIGLETLPYILVTATAVSCLWIAKGEVLAKAARNFGLVFAATAALLLVGATSSTERLSNACDTYSALYGVLAIAGGAGLALLTLVPAFGSAPARRAVAFGGLSLALLALTLLTAPACLYGPYAHVDAEFNRIWLARIEEVLSPLVTARGELGYFFATYVYAVLGFAASLAGVFLVERENKLAAILMCVFSGTALAITTLQVRGMPFAILFGLPGLAAAITRLIERYARTPKAAAIAMVAALVFSANIVFDIAGRYLLEGVSHAEQRSKLRGSAIDCMKRDAVTQLATLPKARVAAMVDQGPAILAYSPHAVIGGPYHRNARGILDSYALFTRAPDIGATILKERGIDYVMICRSSPDYSFYLRESDAGGLLARLDKGRTPAWLQPIPKADKEQKVQIYRVMREKLPN